MKPDLLPGEVLGILGGGQLARMTALAARSLGFGVAVLDPDASAPAVPVADIHIAAALDDPDGARRLAACCRVLTCEFENVAAACLEAAAERVLTRPAAQVFAIAQHRLREKSFVRDLGAPVPDFSALVTASDLAGLPDRPAILKTASSGYDGKGQRRVGGASGLANAWHELGHVPCIVEALVDFEDEISVLVARDRDGAVTSWAPFLNYHHHHILETSLWPAPLPTALLSEARGLAERIAVGLGLVGVLCVELFLTRDGHLLVNELAPRPHNSGHLTIEAATTSQFEQLVRIAAGLPLGSTAPRVGGAAMANLLGDCWDHGVPDFAAALAVPGVSLHLYGKQEARPGRKMGHLTAIGASVEEARDRVLAARSAMRGGATHVAAGLGSGPDSTQTQQASRRASSRRA